MTWAHKELAGWGRYPVIQTDCARPERRSDVLKSFADRSGSPMLAHGLGKSYGDAALLRNGKVILTRRLNRMLGFDAETGWLKVESGVSLKEIIEVFLPRGWFPPVVPGTYLITVGGAIGCNIHGKSHHVDGCFGDHIRRIELLTGRGEIVFCDRDNEPELFWATVGGMGMTGVILSLELQLAKVPNSLIEMETIRFNNLSEFFDIGDDGDHLPHVVSWIDCAKTGANMGRGVYMRGAFAAPDVELNSTMSDLAEKVKALVNGRPFEQNFWLNRATIAMFNEGYFHSAPPGRNTSIVPFIPFFFPLDAVKDWNYVYGSRGFLQYQMVVPTQEAVRECLEIISNSGMASFLAIIKKFGDQDHGGLSFPTKGITLALDFPNYGQPLLDMLSRLDEIVVSVGGRVYLGKDARLAKADFRQMYPEWEKWKDIRDAWDPQGIFQSELGRRLGLC